MLLYKVEQLQYGYKLPKVHVCDCKRVNIQHEAQQAFKATLGTIYI